jgi:3-hydroxyisobutyrate dehydrogenase
MQRVAFLGLGVMGSGMAARLAGAGVAITVWNRTAARAEPLGRLGASIAASPAEAASDADVVLSMLSEDEASRAVWTGASGALDAARGGTLLIESSTVSPAWVRELADLAVARGCSFVDAPVTGSRAQAEAGELLFLVGGDADVFARAKPVLRPMSRDAVHVGPIGSGARLKLVNNFLGGVQAAALAEAFAFIEASGLDRAAALEVLLNGAPGSPLVKILSTRMAARDYTVQFLLSLMRKDLMYAEAEARRHGVPLTTAVNALELYDRAIQAGWGRADFAAIAEVVPGRS